MILKSIKARICDILFVMKRDACVLLGLFVPIKKNKIALFNFNGGSFAGFPRIIAEDIIRNNYDFDLVWISKERPVDLPSQVRWTKIYSSAATLELSSAKFWINNVKNTWLPPKKRHQIYIQTWHGSAGLKKVEADVERHLSKKYVKASKKDSKKINYFLSENKWFSDYVSRSFWYTGEIIKVSFTSKVDTLQKKAIKEKICNKYNLPEMARIIVYAPTFRNSYDKIDFQYDKLFSVLLSDGNTYIITRFHPNDAEKMKEKISFSSRLLNGNIISNVEDLIFASDMFITDYSSTSFICFRNYINCVLYTPDLEEYEEQERDFSFDIRNLPAKISKNVNELYNNIMSFNKNEYIEKAKQINESIGYYDEEVNLKDLYKVLLKK